VLTGGPRAPAGPTSPAAPVSPYVKIQMIEPWFNMPFDFVRVIISEAIFNIWNCIFHIWNLTQKTLTLSPGAPAGPGGPIGPVIPRMPSLPGAPSVPFPPWSPWDKSLLSVLRIFAAHFNCCELVLRYLSGTIMTEVESCASLVLTLSPLRPGRPAEPRSPGIP